jgi:hypothetical protein
LVVGTPSRARAQAQAQAQWTFKVYLGGDNDLVNEGLDNLPQMAAAGPKAKI